MTNRSVPRGEPHLSCVVPVFNAGPWLRICLESILHEPGAEVVAVDDGSTDGSPEVLEVFRKANPGRMDVIPQKNAGPAAARGRWLWFVDADDYLVRGALPLVSEVLERTDCDALAVGMGEFRFFPSSVPPLPKKVLASPSDPATALFAFSSGAPRTIVRRSLWLEAMPEDAVAENVWAEDNLSFARIMLKATNVWRLRAHVYARRRHSGSRSGLGVSMSPFAARTAPRLLDALSALRASAPPELAEALEWRIARVAEYVSSTASMAMSQGLAPESGLEDVAAAKAAARRALSSIPDFAGRALLSETISVWLEKASVQAATEAKISRFGVLRAMRRMRDLAQELVSCVAAVPARMRACTERTVGLSGDPLVHSPESVYGLAKEELAVARRIAGLFRVK